MSFKRELRRKRAEEEPLASSSSSEGEKPKKTRKNLPKAAVKLMMDWMWTHLNDPYPTTEEKLKLALKGKITVLQVSYWFINARRRILPKMIAENQAQMINIEPENKAKTVVKKGRGPKKPGRDSGPRKGSAAGAAVEKKGAADIKGYQDKTDLEWLADIAAIQPRVLLF